ncbi:MAG: outer membrane protein assembly factor BamE, partial [Candidatus Binataceae bacterium]
MIVTRSGSGTADNCIRRARLSLALACGLALAGCGSFSETLQRGYVLQEGALEQIPIGATQEQVLIVLGTPSTVATVSGEAFYYISQKTERDV